MPLTPAHRRSERGQVLVIVALGMIAIVSMVGLVIDGGRAWTRQRDTQNGADAVAKAATVEVQHWLGGLDTPTPDDFDVACAAQRAADANAVVIEEAEYVDAFGESLLPTSVLVGQCTADLGVAIPAGAQGVRVRASETFETLLMRVIGVNDLTAVADATAVVGGMTTFSGGALPITFPQLGTICDSTNFQYEIKEDDGDGTWEPFEIIDEADANTTNLAMVPLCSTAPGSVGFLDFGCGQNMHNAISNPCNISIPIPAWIQTKTGNMNCCESDLNAYAGAVVGTPEPNDTVLSMPIHDGTCRDDLADPQPISACPHGPWSGNGNNLYYHIPFWVGFKLDQAYTQGGDMECGAAPGTPRLNPPGHGVSCLKGWFVSMIPAPGSISPVPIVPGSNVPMSVTLIN
jgi:hypothetical protein